MTIVSLSQESDLAIRTHGSSVVQALRNVDKSAGLPSKSPKSCSFLSAKKSVNVQVELGAQHVVMSVTCLKLIKHQSKAPLIVVLRMIVKLSARWQKDLKPHRAFFAVGFCVVF